MWIVHFKLEPFIEEDASFTNVDDALDFIEILKYKYKTHLKEIILNETI
jgi:hypothetical protein